MEIRTTLLAGVICRHCKRPGDQGQHLWLGGGMVLWHGLEFLITRVNTAIGTDRFGGEGRALRKNIHLEFLLFCLSTLCH